ncbi:MAG: YdcH family protein [Acidisphaera sp.]|nr:YdcH family protein [Acidisphaera sp.]
MSLHARLESLKERHALLETRIADEDSRPRPDSDALVRLKVEKLRLKEEMERLQSAPPET